MLQNRVNKCILMWYYGMGFSGEARLKIASCSSPQSWLNPFHAAVPQPISLGFWPLFLPLTGLKINSTLASQGSSFIHSFKNALGTAAFWKKKYPIASEVCADCLAAAMLSRFSSAFRFLSCQIINQQLEH